MYVQVIPDSWPVNTNFVDLDGLEVLAGLHSPWGKGELFLLPVPTPGTDSSNGLPSVMQPLKGNVCSLIDEERIETHILFYMKGKSWSYWMFRHTYYYTSSSLTLIRYWKALNFPEGYRNQRRDVKSAIYIYFFILSFPAKYHSPLLLTALIRFVSLRLR